jgi:hypothetical protein
MRSRWLRWTTLGLFVAVLAAAAYVLWTTDSASRSISESADNFDRRAEALTRAIMELRMAQQAYVAAGQGDEFWGSKVATQIAALSDELSALRKLASSPRAHAEIEEAISALGDFERMDARAREYGRDGREPRPDSRRKTTRARHRGWDRGGGPGAGTSATAYTLPGRARGGGRT